MTKYSETLSEGANLNSTTSEEKVVLGRVLDSEAAKVREDIASLDSSELPNFMPHAVTARGRAGYAQ